MALAAVGVAQHRAAAFFDLGTLFADAVLTNTILTGSPLFTLQAVLTGRPVFALRAILARAVVAHPIFPRAFIARALITGTLITGTVVASAVFPGPIVARTIIAGAIEVAVAAFVAPAVALLAILVVEVARAVVTRAIITRPVFAGPIVAGPVALPGRALSALGLGLRILLGFGGGLVGGLRLGLGAFVLEVDVEAGGELVAAEEFRRGSVRLHGAQQAEVVFGVLQIVLGQNPVAAGRGVACELLVLFKAELGATAHLDPFGAIGIEGSVGVLLLGLAPAATAAAAVTTALALHSLEISHYSITAWIVPGP